MNLGWDDVVQNEHEKFQAENTAGIQSFDDLRLVRSIGPKHMKLNRYPQPTQPNKNIGTKVFEATSYQSFQTCYTRAVIIPSPYNYPQKTVKTRVYLQFWRL